MERRHFLAASATGLAGAVATPALAQQAGELRWRLTSGFPKSLDTLYGASETFARLVAELTDGKFQIQPFAAGEIVGTFQALDAVTNGTVECAHTGGYYHVGKDPTFAIPCAIPFMLNARQMNAWLYHGGGIDLCNQFFAKHNLFALPAGNTGTQMGGWFRKEVNTLADLKGLKFRIAGLAGQVMMKLGAVPQQIAGGDIYPALERGTIDAAEWVGPYDDEKLGFNKVAPLYYYPGWWEGGPMFHVFINQEKWNGLPKLYKAAIISAAAHTNVDVQAKYDARNAAALKSLVAAGAQLRPFAREIMEAAFKAANELYDEIGSGNAEFKKLYDNIRAFRNDSVLWFQVAEYGFDNFMIRSRHRS